MACLPSHPKAAPKLAKVSLFRNSSQVILKPKASYSYNRMERIVSINSPAVLPTTSSICLYIPVSTLSNETPQLLFVLAAQLENPKQTAERLPASFPEPRHHSLFSSHPDASAQAGGLSASLLLLLEHFAPSRLT